MALVLVSVVLVPLAKLATNIADDGGGNGIIGCDKGIGTSCDGTIYNTMQLMASIGSGGTVIGGMILILVAAW